MLARLARFSYRHRKLMVFGIWLPLLVVLNVVGSSVGTDYRDEFEMPSSESRRVEDVFKSIGSEEDAGYTAQIVFMEERLSRILDLRDIARDLERNVRRSWQMILWPKST